MLSELSQQATATQKHSYVINVLFLFSLSFFSFFFFF